MAGSLIRTLYQSTRTLRGVVKDAGRARTIAAILAKYGFAALVEQRQGRDQKELQEVRREVLEGESIDSLGGLVVTSSTATSRQDLAERLCAMLIELGPTFIKFGQIMSTRPDVIPAHIASRLAKLQDRVDTISVEDVRRAIQDGLGKKPEEIFVQFDETPLASASIAQVHTAKIMVQEKIHDVVVKVQRPHIKRTIESDLSLLRFVAQQVLDIFPEAEMFDLLGMVDEFEKSLLRELDFSMEARSLERVARNFIKKPHIHIPTVFAQASCKTILTMERIYGDKLTALPEGIDRKKVATLYIDAAYQMLFQDGFFHGDLHPGNVFLESDGRLGLIDFGMMGRLPQSLREKIVDVISCIIREDLASVARIWFSIGQPYGHVHYASFEADVIEILERHAVGKSMDQLDLGQFFREMVEGAMRHKIRLPSDFTMMFKAMVTTEGLARQVAHGVNPIDAARPYIETLVRQRYSTDRLKREAMIEGMRLVELMRHLPSVGEGLLRQFDDGKLSFRLKLDNIREGTEHLSASIDRLSVALVASSAAIVGAITVDSGAPVALGLPWISLVAFAIAFLALLAFLRSTRP